MLQTELDNLRAARKSKANPESDLERRLGKRLCLSVPDIRRNSKYGFSCESNGMSKHKTGNHGAVSSLRKTNTPLLGAYPFPSS